MAKITSRTNATERKRGQDLYRAAVKTQRSSRGNPSEYIELLKKAAALGHAEAQENLAAW